MNKLRKYVRELLLKESRFRQMAKPRFTDLKSYLASAAFLNVDAGGEYDDSDVLFSEAQLQLKLDLQKYLDQRFRNKIFVKVSVHSGDLTSASDGYNSAVKDASYFFNGRHNLYIMIAQMDFGESLSDIAGSEQHLYEVISHELLHMQQFLKYSQGRPTAEGFQAFMKEYREAGGAEGMGEDYFFFNEKNGPSEMETFSLQIAKELFHTLGKSKAIALLQNQSFDYNIIRKNSASFRDIEKKSPNALARPELNKMLKQAKEYIKREKQ